MKSALAVALALLSAVSVLGQSKTDSPNRVLVDRVGNTGFIQLRAESFRTLDVQQQALAYWLTQASIAIDPIIYDQLSAYGLREKRLLEGIMAYPKGINPAVLAKISEFTKLFWANRGNHNEDTSQKFLPEFTYEQLREAAVIAQKNGAFCSPCAGLCTPEPVCNSADVLHEVEALRAPLFDADFEPMSTAKTPENGKDIIQASSNTFYGPGVSLSDLKGFHEIYPLDSRVVKTKEGKLEELVYRVGTPDRSVPPGLYAPYLQVAINYLHEAQRYADPKQQEVIGRLIRFYETGDFKDWLSFGQAWVQDDATVDFANGFIEVYRDARGAKGSSQSFVTVTDKPVTAVMTKLAANAAYFEQKAPWEAKYKRETFHMPVVKAVETLIETGDFNVTTVGDNLPNENEIHEKFGTKNFLFTASSRALNDAVGHSGLEEFGASPEVIERGKKYGDEGEDLFTALHEVIGHGSGKLSERLTHGAEPYLKEYFSTLEEARADLMALWNAWDPKLKELGLVSNQEEVAKTMYDSSALVALTQLRRIPKGNTIEEDHQRDRQLIVRYIQDRFPGSIEQFDRNGKTYIRVADYQKMRQGVGALLAELMRIKAEGDYPAIKALVDKYGVHFDPALRDQIVARYKRLDIPVYWAGINPALTATFNKSGMTAHVEMSYPQSPTEQYLRYAAMYDPSIAASLKSGGAEPQK